MMLRLCCNDVEVVMVPQLIEGGSAPETHRLRSCQDSTQQTLLYGGHLRQR